MSAGPSKGAVLIPFFRPLRAVAGLLLAVCVTLVIATSASAADRDRLRAFLTVTGFDVALESIKLSAEDAPRMLGLEAQDFGAAWTLMAGDVFDVKDMQADAMTILGQTLSDEALSHAADFYASDLGQRLVEAENASHMRDGDEKRGEGGELLAELQDTDPERIVILQRMMDAIGSDEQSLRAAQAERADEVIESMRLSGMAGSAATYRDFSNEDLEAYTEALEHPLMQEVYELMNAVQYEIMANRFEEVADRLGRMSPGQEL